jgi:hypothetical protein
MYVATAGSGHEQAEAKLCFVESNEVAVAPIWMADSSERSAPSRDGGAFMRWRLPVLTIRPASRANLSIVYPG